MQKISDGAVFIDLDDTLALSSELNGPTARLITKTKGSVLYKHEGKDRVARLRPGVLDFLKELRQDVNNVFILTTGGVNHQKLVTDALGITTLVDGIFNLGSQVPQFRWPVLVDDLAPTTSGAMAKLEKMGVVKPEDWLKRDAKMEKYVSKFFCQVDPWIEDNFNDNVFEEVIQDTLHKLRHLIGNNYWGDGQEIYIPE